MKTIFPAHVCQTDGCPGRLEADGGEYHILRKSLPWAFSHDLLYHWGDKSSVGGAPFFMFWRDTVQKYIR